MPFSQHDHMIQTVMPDGSDQPLHVSPLPWAGRRGEDFLHTHALDSLAKVIPIDLISISQYVTGRRIFRKRLHHLLPCPPSTGVLRHVKVNYAPTLMSEHYQDKQDPKGGGRNREEINRDEIGDMVVQESLPSLGRWLSAMGQQAGNGALGNLDSQLEQFPVNARRTPIRVRGCHPLD